MTKIYRACITLLMTFTASSACAEEWRFDGMLGNGEFGLGYQSTGPLYETASIAVQRDGDSDRILSVAVGAPGATTNEVPTPHVQIFSPDPAGRLVPRLRIEPSGPPAHSGFGLSVAVSGNLLAIGEPNYLNGEMIGAGRVCVYRDISGDGDFTSLVGCVVGGVEYGFLGSHVDIDGRHLAAGAPGHADGGQVGSVAVVRVLGQGNLWTLQPLGTVPGLLDTDLFGHRVAIRHLDATRYVLVASMPHQMVDGRARAGSAQVYANVNGHELPTLISTLQPAVAQTNALFGASLGINEDYIAVGGPFRASGLMDAPGSITLFEPAPIFGYTRVDETFPNGAGDYARCGSSLSLDRRYNHVLVGCPLSNSHLGAARVFEIIPGLSGTTLVVQRGLPWRTTPNSEHRTYLGIGSALVGGTAFVGHEAGPLVGRVAIFGFELFRDGFE